jgi:nucleoid-associated protein YgaU
MTVTAFETSRMPTPMNPASRRPAAGPRTVPDIGSIGRSVRAAVLLLAAIEVAALTWRLRPAGGLAGSDPDSGIVTACAWLAWAVVGYVTLAVAVAALAHLPAVGALARGAAGRLTPGLLRRAVEHAVTAGLVASLAATLQPVTASAATRPAAVMPAGGPGAAAAGAPLDWPGLPALTSPLPVATSTGPAAPTSPGLPTVQPHHHPPATVTLVSPAPRRSQPAGSAGSGAAATVHIRDTTVVVRAGDTLWSIAAGRLGPGASATEISAAWHAWYAANRATIGPDPGLIQPGQQLVAPHAELTGWGR